MKLRQAIHFSDSYDDGDSLEAVSVVSISKKKRVFYAHVRGSIPAT